MYVALVKMLLLLLTLSLGLAEGLLYVLPASSSPAECPAGPCLTLEQYTQESSRYMYFTDNASFLFLPGSHSLRAPLNLTAVSNISLRGTQNGTATIMCEASITLENVTEFYIHEMSFQLHLAQALTSVFDVVKSEAVVFSETVFQQAKSTGPVRAISCTQCEIKIFNCFFEANTGKDGGAIFAQRAKSVNLTGNVFTENEAERFGGAVYAESSVLHLRGNNFTANSASEGGGALYCLECNCTTLCAVNNFTSNFLTGNEDSVGGAIAIRGGCIDSKNRVNFISNTASKGGAVSLIGVQADFNIDIYSNNSAILGGALYAFSSKIQFDDTHNFVSNSAVQGGAMYLLFGTMLNIQWYAELHMTDNTAKEYGGAIYHEDVARSIQCSSAIYEQIAKSYLIVPDSFLQIDQDVRNILDACPNISSHNNSAAKGGNFLFGGLLDRSKIRDVDPNELKVSSYDYFTSVCSSISQDLTTDISSEPYELLFCNMQLNFSIETYKGLPFSLHVKATGQGSITVPATINAVLSGGTLGLNQSSQYITYKCSKLTYNVYSANDYEELTINAQGPCGFVGQATLKINVTFLPCPIAFVDSGDECVCEDRLKQLKATCTFYDNSVFILRSERAKFWVNIQHRKKQNELHKGIILSPSCPADYCTAQTVNFSLDDPDAQCNSHRTGVLCGKCAANFSLLLGGSRCGTCSNLYLLLIIPFALAGVGLVALLSVTRLTVATGTVNSLIFYANFVQVNRHIFFPSNKTNPLTVFVAWMNLDFGFQTCFFDGMDSFSRSLLQFLFPLYVLILSSLIALLSRYSTRLSKLISHNPIAIVATLLLMSYSKIFKTSIDIFFFANLEYPDKHVTVWAKDGNLTYFHSKHLLLFILALLVAIFFILPYTLLLLLGHLLLHHRLPYRFYYHRLVLKIKPLLDSYYAPYKAKTRCWTGMLLILRCVLYIMFTFDSPEMNNYSLLAIISTLFIFLSTIWLIDGVYRHLYMNFVDISLYMNLILLSAAAATLPDRYKEITADIMVGMFVTTAVGVTLYHVYLTYLTESALWLKVRSKLPCCRRVSTIDNESQASLVREKEPANKEVTTTVVDL